MRATRYFLSLRQAFASDTKTRSRVSKYAYDAVRQTPRRLPPTRCYLNPIFGGGVVGAAVGDALRCPGGRLTKIPYLRGGGSGGTDGGNDGSRILKSHMFFFP